MVKRKQSTVNAKLIKAWREWLRRPVPTANFRNGRTNSPTYELEHDIDHSVSYVHGLVQNLIAGKKLDYERLASKELFETEELVAKLNRSELYDEEKQKFLRYLSEMILILKELKESGSA